MKINLWKPGEVKYNEIEVDIGDKIQLKTWEMELLGGTVTTINDEYIEVLIENVLYDHADLFTAGEKYTFNYDDIYGIDVILKTEEIKSIERAINSVRINEFVIEFFKTIGIHDFIKFDKEDLEKLTKAYTETLDNRIYFDNVLKNNHNNPIYVILKELEEKYRRKSYQIEIDTEEDEEIIKDKISHLGILKTIKKVEG